MASSRLWADTLSASLSNRVSSLSRSSLVKPPNIRPTVARHPGATQRIIAEALEVREITPRRCAFYLGRAERLRHGRAVYA